MAKRTQRRKSAARSAGPSAQGERPRTASTRAASDDAIIDAAMELAASKGWSSTTLVDIADAAGLSFGQLYDRFRSKGAIFEAFVRRIDHATLAGAETAAHDESVSVRDRLFELFMRRFDALNAYKPAVAALARDLMFRPLASLCVAGRLARSMAWLGSAAGVPTAGPLGVLRVKALVAVYLYVMRVWLRDDSTDHAKTMAVLDKALQRAEMLAQSVPAGLRRRGGAAAP
jgi:AcrR family transcriptional regulator